MSTEALPHHEDPAGWMNGSLAKRGKEMLASLLGKDEKTVRRSQEESKTFEATVQERDELMHELQLVKKISAQDFFGINDLLVSRLQDPEKQVKAVVDIFQEGLRRQGPMSMKVWTEITNNWLQEHGFSVESSGK